MGLAHTDTPTIGDLKLRCSSKHVGFYSSLWSNSKDGLQIGEDDGAQDWRPVERFFRCVSVAVTSSFQAAATLLPDNFFLETRLSCSGTPYFLSKVRRYQKNNINRNL